MRWIPFHQPTAAQLCALTTYISRSARRKRIKVNQSADLRKMKQGSLQTLSERYNQVQFLRGHHNPALMREGPSGFARGRRARRWPRTNLNMGYEATQSPTRFVHRTPDPTSLEEFHVQPLFVDDCAPSKDPLNTTSTSS